MALQETIYTIERPPLPKNWESLTAHLSPDHKRFLIDLSENPEYLYWDKIKYKKMDSLPFSHEVAWALITQHRRTLARATRIQSEEGSLFGYVSLQRWDKTLHTVDKIFLNRPLQKNHPVEPWMLEAISSSMIEGAHTTRERALDLLRLHKTPGDYSERMILNNYKMARMLENLPKNFQVDVQTLLDWQSQLTHNNMDKKDQGRMRTDNDHIVIAPKTQDVVTFIPPRRTFLDEQLPRLLDFLNSPTNDLHPLIHAICLHFWFAYLHPFVDGNGRTARALFYWSMMKAGYPNITSLPLSPLILKTLQQYRKAFIYSEQDNFDLTYFLDFNMRLIEQALEQYSVAQPLPYEDKTLWDESLNLRQNTVIALLKKGEVDDVNVSFVKQRFGVSKLTAINDLKDLVSQGVLECRRVGKNILYRLKR